MSKSTGKGRYARIMSSFHSHDKRFAAGIDTIGLWAICLSYSADKQTDGVIPQAFISTCLTRPDRRKTLERGIEVEMFEPVGDAFVIHDYLDHNPSKQHMDHLRRVRSAARKGATN